MDEYTFSYVNPDGAFRAPSPQQEALIDLPLAKPKSKIRPPQADVRPRGTSWPQKRKQSPLPKESTDFSVASQWSDSEDDTDDELIDPELKSARDVYQTHLATCSRLLEHAAIVLNTLNDIQNGFEAVSEQTLTLQTSCTALQAEEVRLARLADGVRSTLQPFSLLESANRLLNAPGSTIVLTSAYQDLLVKLDAALDFLASHPDYRDAEFYTRQYRQALTKALTLARVFFISSMKEVNADIINRTQINAMNKNTQSALLYTKFKSIVPRVRPLMINIDKARSKHEEYWSLLNDCWQSYFGVRRYLLSRMIQNTFKELANIVDISTFCTSAISFIRSLAMDEQDLFRSIFSSGTHEFAVYLNGLGQYFTDAIRPRIAAESSLSTLCEICGGMQSQCEQYSDDQELVTFDMTPILSITLGEIEQRIVLRAQGVVINEIQGYKPSDKDLDYPGSLKRLRPAARRINSMKNGLGLKPVDGSQLTTKAEIGDGEESLTSTVVHEQWYVTLRVSISLLSKIYRLVQSSLFDDLAHEVVRSCIASLLHASNQIKRKSTIDGHLFLLKHMIVLKDQIAAFDIEYTPKDAKSSLNSMSDALWDLQARGEIFNPSSLYNLASSGLSKLASVGYLSRKVENMADARDEIEDQTRLVIGTLTLHCAEQCTFPLRTAMGNKISEPAALLEVNRKFRAGIPDSLTLYGASFDLYLQDERVIGLLMGIIQDEILENYERFDTYTKRISKESETVPPEIPSVRATVEWLEELTRIYGGEES